MVPFFGRYRLDAITGFLVEKYIHERKGSTSRRHRPPANATINRELAVLKHMFNKAIAWGEADANPVRGIRLLQEPPPPERILTADEEARLLQASSPHLRLAILIALHTGLRLKDILGLSWKDVDLAGGMITVERSKGGKRVHVEINSYLKAGLVEYRKLQAGEWLFVSARTGRPILSPKTAFANALRRSGIAHCRFHGLRHTFGTRLDAAGVGLVTIQKLMGHSTVRVTERYSHPGAAERRRAVELLAGRLDRSAANVVPFAGGVAPTLHSDGHLLDTTTVEGRNSESAISLNCK